MKNQSAIKFLDHVIVFIFLATVFLFPLVFNPFAANLFELSKTVFLVVMTGLLTSFLMIRNMVAKSFHLTITSFGLSYILVQAIIFIRLISLNLPRFLENMLTVGGLTLSLTLFFLFASTLKNRAQLSTWVIMAITSSATILSILSILETAQMGPGKILQAINKTTESQAFVTPAGSAAILLSFVIPVLLLTLVMAITKRDVKLKSFFFGSAAVMTASLVISIFTILPGKPNAPVFIPFSTSWLISVENIKSPKNLFVGVGSANYIKAFSLHRGVEYNATEQWNTRFVAARNYPLHLFTTVGLLGFAAWCLLLFLLIKTSFRFSRQSWEARASLISLFSLVLIILIIPNNFMLQFLFTVFLLILTFDLKANRDSQVSELLLKLFAAKLVDQEHLNQYQDSHKTEVLPIILGVPIILLTLFGFYGSYRVMAADMVYRQSLLSANTNDGSKTYDLQRNAIGLNPYFSLYHRTYASTNLALANGLSSNPELSDTDKETVSTLVRQAIREGQNAVRINPDNPSNWETLANVYKNLLNVAEGSDQWTLTAYSQAITLDPTSPRLWLEVGSVFYRLNRFPDAISAFQRAAALKPDWANAHYNLANAYKENKETERAVATLEVVMRLLEPGTADYNKAREELIALKEELGVAEETGPEKVNTNLTDPNEEAEVSLPDDSQVELTNEDAPPVETEANGFGDVIDSQTPEASESGEGN